MKGKLHLVAGVLFLLALGYDFYLWGGLSHTAQMGPVVRRAAEREVSLAGIYLPAGRELLAPLGLAGSARDAAQASFESLQPRLLANPAVAMDTLTVGMPWLARGAYYGAPLLLALAGLLWWRRPRDVHLIRGR